MEMRTLSEVEAKCNTNVAFKFMTAVWKLKYTVDLKLSEPEIFSPYRAENVISFEQLDCAQSIQNFELKSVLHLYFIIEDLASLINSANGQVGDKKLGLGMFCLVVLRC